MKKQSYDNHKKYDLKYQIIFLSLISFVLIASIINLINNLDEPSQLLASSILVGLSIAGIMNYYFIKFYSIKLQDRVIRAEENLRHYQLTGELLSSKLHMSQISALRYSPDSEFVELSKEAVEKHLTTEEIKKSISRWKGDYYQF